MSEEIKPEVLPGDLITGPGLYEARNGDIVRIVEHDGAWWVCECDGKRDWYHSDGTRRFKSTDSDRWKLVRWIGPPPADEPTTSEQIAEIEGQAEPQPVQVCEGRWRTRNGEIRHVTPTPWTRNLLNKSSYSWYDAHYNQTWLPSGRYHLAGDGPFDLLEYLGPIELEAKPEPEPEPQTESDFELRIRALKQCSDNQAETIGRLQGEVRDLRTQLAEATQERYAQTARIGHLETINAGQATAVKCAGEQNTQLRTLVDNARRQLEAAADEISELRKSLDDAEKQLDQKDAQIRDLRIELDAAQQIQKPLTDDHRELIWNEATKFAGQQVVGWLQPLVHALSQQPDERFLSFMALTLAALPDIVPRVLGYEEDERGEVAEE